MHSVICLPFLAWDEKTFRFFFPNTLNNAEDVAAKDRWVGLRLCCT